MRTVCLSNIPLFYSVELTCYLTDQFEKVKSEPVYFFVTDIKWADSTKDVLMTSFQREVAFKVSALIVVNKCAYFKRQRPASVLCAG